MSRLVYLTFPAIGLMYVALYVASGWCATAAFVTSQALTVTVLVVVLKGGLRGGLQPIGTAPGSNETESEPSQP